MCEEADGDTSNSWAYIYRSTMASAKPKQLSECLSTTPGWSYLNQKEKKQINDSLASQSLKLQRFAIHMKWQDSNWISHTS